MLSFHLYVNVCVLVQQHIKLFYVSEKGKGFRSFNLIFIFLIWVQVNDMMT